VKRSRAGWQLALIVLVAISSLYVTLNIPHPDWLRNALFWQPEGRREIALRQGLDLQGGLQVLLAADVASGEELEAASMETARRIVENRVNSLGLTEPIVQSQGERKIIVELPGIENPEQAVEMIKGTALLEFVDVGGTYLPPNTAVTTTLGGPPSTGEASQASDALPTSQVTSTVESSPTLPSDVTFQAEPQALETILTGADLSSVGMDLDQQTGATVVTFELNNDAAQIFADHTATHIGQYLCIVLDKAVVSCPVIQVEIPTGQGQIQGDFTYDSARQLMLQLRYGALPVPLRVESFNRIGATLGAESVDKSIRAGAIGLGIVLLFMLVYYRLPGALADVALGIYVLANFALYKLIPVTLTLPGIAGFILSTGMAVDANILIFERVKEELRQGRRFASAVEIGFARAWPSIRDGQLSTLIICTVLFLFGTNFGASIVKGFAITLAVGTVVNLFTAVFATRTFMRLVAGSAGSWLAQRRWLMGV
jgi:protein-export membrane protein SecD